MSPAMPSNAHTAICRDNMRSPPERRRSIEPLPASSRAIPPSALYEQDVQLTALRSLPLPYLPLKASLVILTSMLRNTPFPVNDQRVMCTLQETTTCFKAGKYLVSSGSSGSSLSETTQSTFTSTPWRIPYEGPVLKCHSQIYCRVQCC